MQVDTEHLVRDINDLSPTKRKIYTKIPNHLQDDVDEALDGESETYRTTPNLALWAKEKREAKAKHERRIKNKQARRTRKKQRK